MKKVCSFAVAVLFVASLAQATLVREKFLTDPVADGWKVYGVTNLFQWNADAHVLNVTWDSSQTNSYYYLPLDRTYTKADGFFVQFDLNLTDTAAVGYFQVAAGLCNFSNATSATFSRSTGVSPNLFEFDYFPDGPNSYGPSIDASMVDQSNQFYFAFDDSQPMANETTYHVELIHWPGTSAIVGCVYTNGQPFTKFPKVDNYGANDFKLDTLAIFNYTTTDDPYGDSLLAHGTISNIAFASPLPIGLVQPSAAAKVQFGSDTNWLYTLQQSTDLVNWSAATPATPGNGTNLVLQANNPPADHAAYRVDATLP